MTDFFDHIATRTLTLRNQVEDVVDITLSRNNETPQRVGRLSYQFKDGYPAEIEIEPGPNVPAKGNIVSQVMQLGPITPTGRARITTGIYADNAGGLSCVIDSSTTDPSGSPGQANSMPLVLNVGEAKGQYIVLFADGRVELKQGAQEKTTTVANLIALLK